MKTVISLFLLVTSMGMQSSSAATPADESGEYYALIASMTSHVIASLNLSSGEVKILHSFEKDEGPKGIAIDRKGNLYVSLRYGGMNVLRLTPKENESGFLVSDFTGLIGKYGPGKLRITDKGELLVAGGTMGMIYRFNVVNGRETTPMAPRRMNIVVGLDAAGNEAYTVEIFGRKLARFELTPRSAKSFWLSKRPEPSLKRCSGIAAGPDKNLLVTNTENSVIAEFSSETGKHLGVFFDLKPEGASSSSDIRYVPELKCYFITAGKSIFKIDTTGKLLRKYQMTSDVNGGSAIVIVNKQHLAKSLADKL